MSMFKNLTIYNIAGVDAAAWPQTTPQPFAPCTASQQRASGWVPPRGHAHGALVEAVAGQLIYAYKTADKLLPAKVVQRRAQEMAKALEQSTGRKPGRKQLKELREQATLELLPQAFTREATTLVWLDLHACRLVVDCVGKRAEEIATELLKFVPGLQLRAFETQEAPSVGMTSWVCLAPPDGLSVGTDGLLLGERKASVRYAKGQPLTLDVLRQPLNNSMGVSELALNWRGRVSFVFTAGWRIKRLAFDDVLFEQASHHHSATGADAFDTDLALATGELMQLITDLEVALGGLKPAQP